MQYSRKHAMFALTLAALAFVRAATAQPAPSRAHPRIWLDGAILAGLKSSVATGPVQRGGARSRVATSSSTFTGFVRYSWNPARTPCFRSRSDAAAVKAITGILVVSGASRSARQLNARFGSRSREQLDVVERADEILHERDIRGLSSTYRMSPLPPYVARSDAGFVHPSSGRRTSWSDRGVAVPIVPCENFGVRSRPKTRRHLRRYVSRAVRSRRRALNASCARAVHAMTLCDGRSG